MMRRTEWLLWTTTMLAMGCGSAGVGGDGFGPGGPNPGGTDGDTDGDTEGDETADGTVGEGDCQDGNACEGGTCVAGGCCPSAQACGSICCGDGEVCSFGSCVVPAGPCETGEDCTAGQYCELGLGDGEGEAPDPGCAGGDVLDGLCLPLPPECEGDEPLGPGGLPTCVHACDVMPDSSDLSTVLKHQIEGPGYTAPVVIQLDDDDCDGAISERDIPEIVWNMHTGADYGNPTNGRIKAISIEEGGVVERFTYDSVLPLSQVAAGDIDGSLINGNEVVACASDNTVVALRFDGSVKWQSAPGTCGTSYPGGGFDLSVPNIADLDEDGVAEVITERAILDGATGATEVTLTGVNGTVAVSDVDGDGWLDIVSGGQAWDRNGVLIAAVGNANLLWPAVGDLDGDGSPEIAAVNFSNRSLAIWRVSGGAAEVIRGGLSLDAPGLPSCGAGSGAGGNGNGGGPPTIGDFDGDGTADVALAAGNAYVVYDGVALMNGATGADTVLWANPTNDCSSAQTGSTLFDFDGNGRVEVVYGDQELLRVYDGLTGATLAEHPHPTGTINEYPVVADVDADGQADIVAITRETCGDMACGELRVYGSATGGWVRTRRVWNQHTYHVTNVEESGAIPQGELDNWAQAGLNNFRQNKQPGGEFSAGDAAVTLLPACFGGYSLTATVRNLGQAPIPEGAVVTFFADSPGGEVLGELATTTTLYPAQSQVLELPLDGPPDTDAVYATVSAEVPECDTGNNTSDPADPTCIPAG